MSDETVPTQPVEELPFATKEGLLGLANKRAYKDVSTAVGKVRLRTLVGAEAFEIDNFAYDSKGTYDRSRERYARAKRFVETIVGSDNNPLFSDFDLQAIANWPEPLANTLAVEIMGMTKPDALGMFAKNA